MFEARRQPLATRSRFLRRMGLSVAAALGVDLATLVVGALGFHLTEGLAWLDATLDASLVMTGNGPLHPMSSAAGKVFTTWFALLGGVAFVIVAGVILTPVFHRVLHRFHLDPDAGAAPGG